LEVHDVENRLQLIVELLKRQQFKSIIVQQQSSMTYNDEETGEAEYRLEIDERLKLFYCFAERG
jgi:hypothetical protein